MLQNILSLFANIAYMQSYKLNRARASLSAQLPFLVFKLTSWIVVYVNNY